MVVKIIIGWVLLNLIGLAAWICAIEAARRRTKPDLPCHDQGNCLSCTNWEACAEIKG